MYVSSYLAKESRVKSSYIWRHDCLVHSVQFRKCSSGWVALLHQVKNRCHTRALKLSKNLSTLEAMVHHFDIRFNAPNEVSSLKAKEYL